MGSPASPSPQQLAQLQVAGKLAESGSPTTVQVENGRLNLHLSLPRQAVTLLVFDLRP
jgi:xylan 1,4-beta-xylosidase